MKKRPLVACLLAFCLCGAFWFVGHRHSSLFAQSSGPTLSIPSDIQAGSPGTVVVPIAFAHNQSGIAAMTFSLAYDAACLAIDSVDAAEEVAFALPSAMRGSVLFDADDAAGQIDVAIADYSPPLSTLPNREALVAVTFSVVCVPPVGETITTAVEFSQSPPASFSNTLGRSVNGTVLGGSVVIQNGPLPSPTSPTGTPSPTVTVEPVNTAPTAVDDSATTREFRAVNIAVLENDSDPDGDLLTITEVTQGGFGTVTIQPDGTLLYAPEPGQNGTDLFSYIISDGRGGLAEGLVTVTVTEFNVPPIAQDDIATTVRNRSVTIDVLANDTDVDALPDAPEMTVVVLGQPLLGSTELTEENQVLFRPRPGYVGVDEFWYSVIDSEGGSDVAKVTVTITPFNRAPEVEPSTEILSYEAGREANLLILATDADGDPLTFSATGLPPGLSIDAETGEIRGKIAETASGTYEVTVSVSDGDATTSITFTMDVAPRVVATPQATVSPTPRSTPVPTSAPTPTPVLTPGWQYMPWLGS